jgi:hypothetical protein
MLPNAPADKATYRNFLGNGRPKGISGNVMEISRSCLVNVEKRGKLWQLKMIINEKRVSYLEGERDVITTRKTRCFIGTSWGIATTFRALTRIYHLNEDPKLALHVSQFPADIRKQYYAGALLTDPQKDDFGDRLYLSPPLVDPTLIEKYGRILVAEDAGIRELIRVNKKNGQNMPLPLMRIEKCTLGWCAAVDLQLVNNPLLASNDISEAMKKRITKEMHSVLNCLQP